MDRWWADRARAERVADFWTDGDDPQILTGTAFLVLHAIGEHHIAKHAGWQGSGSISKALADIGEDPLIGAVCQVLDDVSGIPGYGAARAAQWKNDADQGAISTVAGMVSEKSPRAMAMKRAAESYGLPSQDAVRIRKALLSTDFVSSNACDRVLMAYASIIADAESSAISKLERDQFEIDGILRTVNRDKAGRFAAQDKSIGAKQARAKQRRERFMSEAAKRKLIAESKAGGAKGSSNARLVAEEEKVREQPLEARAPTQPEEEARQARLAHRRKVVQRAGHAGKVRTAQQQKVEAEARDRIKRDMDALRSLHDAQLARMDEIVRRTDEAQAAKTKPKPKPKEEQQEQQQGVYRAKKLPKLKTFDSSDPSGTARAVYLTTPDNRKIILMAPMMMVPESGQRVSGGWNSPDPVSVLAMYAGLGNSADGYAKANEYFNNRKRPDSARVYEEVEDVHAYVNLLMVTNGDVGRVMQMAEDATKTDTGAMARKYFKSPVTNQRLQRDLATAEKLARSDSITWNIPDMQRWENMEQEQGTYKGRSSGTLWHEAHPVRVDLPDGISVAMAGRIVQKVVEERAAAEDSAWIVGDGGHEETYGDFVSSIAAGVPAMQAGKHVGATNPSQLIRFARALQIYALIESGDSQRIKASKMGFQYPKQVGEVQIDQGSTVNDVEAEEIGAVVQSAIAQLRYDNEDARYVELTDMDYRALVFPDRKDHTVIKVQQQISAGKKFDGENVLGMNLPAHFGVPPVPLIPATVQHVTEMKDEVLPADDATLLNISEHWRAAAEVGGGGMLLKNINEITHAAKKKVAEHNISEEKKAAESKKNQAQQPPWV